MSNIFASTISTAKPTIFSSRPGEVLVPNNVPTDKPIETNTFYGNMLVENQDCGVWTHPYSVWNSKDAYYGLAMYLALESDRVYGPGSPASYFYLPTGIKEIVLSSQDFSSAPLFGLTLMSKFGATATFTSTSVSGSKLSCPLVQGMGFVTGIYLNSIPMLCSQVGFASVIGVTSPRSNIQKYKITLFNSKVWLLYIYLPEGQSLQLSKSGTNKILCSNSVDGAVVQLCAMTGSMSSVLDSAAGCYCTDSDISAVVSGLICLYSISYTTSGSSNQGVPLVFALPHHVAAMDSITRAKMTTLTLPTTTKGTATGFLTSKFTMEETLPLEIKFSPYTSLGKSANYSSNALAAIRAAAAVECNDDVVAYSDLDSMYVSGKILSKYAQILYVCCDILNDAALVNLLMPKLKAAIERFSSNTQQLPLFYDTEFKGIVSSATGGADYGNGHYNDHHFHYGYHVHAVALTAYVDNRYGGSWVKSIQDWTNCLVRDVANPNTSDPYFPVFRLFDFYNGHSWAKGLYASADGKDEESTSEDYHFAYAMKLWALVIGDAAMENRANLMLAIMRRTINNYFLYTDGNNIEPSKFVGNMVSGILFENKIDYTTYFGTLVQYIHGIQMIPITPVSSFIRNQKFVSEEWESKLGPIVGGITDGWRGILMLNYALADPTSAYNFFSSPGFSKNYLDNGMSLTWALAYCAGVGASS